MKIKLKDILPNPYRDMVESPLNLEVVAKLKSSINDTGFWDNVLVRKHPVKESKFEAAFGHHRLEAARQAGILEADFILKKISDEAMLEIMSRENDQAYGKDLRTTIEAVKALVLAVAAGKISAARIAPMEGERARTDTYRYAPSFVVGKKPSSDGKGPSLPYTTLSVAKFLGFTEQGRGGLKAEDKVVAALAALEMREVKLWTNATMGTFRVEGVIPAAKVLKAATDTKARAALVVERTTIRHQQAKEAAEIMKAQLATGEAERRANDEEQQRIIAARAADLKMSAERKVRLDAEDRAAKAKAEEERLERVKVAKAEQKRIDKEIADSEAARLKAERAAEQAAAVQWISRCKALRDKVDRLFTNEDGMHGELTLWVRNKLVTDNQRAELLLSLQKLARRVEEFSVTPTAPARSATGGKQ